MSTSEALISSLCHEIHSNIYLIKPNVLARHREELLSHPELFCFTKQNPQIQTELSLPLSPGLSGEARFRLHKDQVRSRETANRNRPSGEKAICVTVRVWHGSACSWRHVAVLHRRIAACSTFDAWNDITQSMCLSPQSVFSFSVWIFLLKGLSSLDFLSVFLELGKCQRGKLEEPGAEGKKAGGMPQEKVVGGQSE